MAIGLGGIGLSKASRICQQMDEAVQAFLDRPLEHEYPQLWLDVIHTKMQHDPQAVNRVLLIAVGIRDSGEREAVGMAIGRE